LNNKSNSYSRPCSWRSWQKFFFWQMCKHEFRVMRYRQNMLRPMACLSNLTAFCTLSPVRWRWGRACVRVCQEVSHRKLVAVAYLLFPIWDGLAAARRAWPIATKRKAFLVFCACPLIIRAVPLTTSWSGPAQKRIAC
jgi:hypothetical protein